MTDVDFGLVRNPREDCLKGRCMMNCSPRDNIPGPQTSWDAWVRIGVGLHSNFIEDVTIYDCAQKPGYRRARITLIDPEQEGGR